MVSIIRDESLAESGQQKIEWVRSNMPILRKLEEEYQKTKPFSGLYVSMSIHLEAKTAYLAKLFKIAGAKVSITGSNPLSTQDDVAAALVKEGLDVYATYNCTKEEYFEYIDSALGTKPNILIDDGGDLVNHLLDKKEYTLPHVMGGCEETTTGVMRLQGMEKSGKLKFPMIAVNNAYSKYLFDNRYGTGQSVWDGINRTTNLIVAGKNVVVAGYGWCGKGVAMRAKGFGANVIVCEVDPIKSIEAHMDGFTVLTMKEAAKIGDFFVTVTGCKDVITREHFETMRDGAIVCNAGHFNVEISINDLEEIAIEKREQRKNIMGYKLNNEKWINLLAEGRLVNLAAGDGHPAEIMDMSFALQLLSSEYILNNYKNLENKVYDVPVEIDKKVSQMKLETMGINIDTLSEEQERYIEGE